MSYERLMDVYTREGVEAVRERIDYVIDTALSPDHPVSDVDEGAIVFVFGRKVVAVISYMLDTEGKRDSVTDVMEAIDIAEDYLQEQGFHYWLDQVVPLWPVRAKREEVAKRLLLKRWGVRVNGRFVGYVEADTEQGAISAAHYYYDIAEDGSVSVGEA